MSVSISWKWLTVAIVILAILAAVLAISLASSGGSSGINRVIPGAIPAQAAPKAGHGPLDSDGDRDVNKKGVFIGPPDGDSDDGA